MTGRRAFRPVSAAVVLLVLTLTAVLTVAAWEANLRSEQRLLDRQLAQVGTLLSAQAGVLQTELTNIGQVAVNTQGRPDTFARFAAQQLQQTGQSLTLWRIGGENAEQIARSPTAPSSAAVRSSTPASSGLRAAAEALRPRSGNPPDADAAGPPLDEALDELLTTVTVADGKDDTVLLGIRWTS